MRNGIIEGLSNADHHADPAIGSSGLKEFQRTPAHFWAKYRDPDRPERSPTPAMRIGSAWHAAVFEPQDFATRYTQMPEGLDRRTKEGKALWAEIEASGREVLSTDDWSSVRTMAANARKHPVSSVIFGLEGGAAEVSMFWTDDETGARCKIRPDYFVPPCSMFPGGLLVDGKTGEDMSALGFARYAWNWELHIQAAFYVDGFQQVMGSAVAPTFLWLAQEKEAPHASVYYSAASDFLDYGRRLYRRHLRTFAACTKSGQWPGYPATVQPLELPAWAAKTVADATA